MSLPRLTYLGHLSLSTSICQTLDLLPRLHQIPYIHHFLGGIIHKRDMNVMVGSWVIHLNSYKSFKNWVWRKVSKRRVEFVKDDVIGYIVTTTSSEWKVIEMLGKTQILIEKLIQKWRWIINHIVMEFCHFAFYFGITSHLWTKHVFSLSICCSEIKRCLAFYFDKILWSNSNMRLRLINLERLKVFWLQKWLDVC